MSVALGGLTGGRENLIHGPQDPRAREAFIQRITPEPMAQGSRGYFAKMRLGNAVNAIERRFRACGAR